LRGSGSLQSRAWETVAICGFQGAVARTAEIVASFGFGAGSIDPAGSRKPRHSRRSSRCANRISE
jgi:hypothetical protein